MKNICGIYTDQGDCVKLEAGDMDLPTQMEVFSSRDGKEKSIFCWGFQYLSLIHI